MEPHGRRRIYNQISPTSTPVPPRANLEDLSRPANYQEGTVGLRGRLENGTGSVAAPLRLRNVAHRQAFELQCLT